MYDSTKVKVDPGTVRPETNEEWSARQRDQLPLQLYLDRKVGPIDTNYDFARKRGLVTYSPLGLRSRHDR